MADELDPRIPPVLGEMCDARGYQGMERKGLVDHAGTCLIGTCSQGRVMVLYSDLTAAAGKLCTGDLMGLVRIFLEHGVDIGIVVFGEATLNAMQAARLQHRVKVEMIRDADVTVNPTKHCLVPAHEALRADEVADLVK